MSRVLLIDDDPGTLETFAIFLRRAGYDVATASSGRHGLTAVRHQVFDVLVTDLRLPDISGLDVVRALPNRRRPAVILMTAFACVDSAIQAIGLKVANYLEKPISGDALVSAVRDVVPCEERSACEASRATAHARTRVARTDPRPDPLAALLGRGEQMCRVREQLRIIASADGPVLIEGETGTGKEIAANAVHQVSPRRNGPFIAINCAAISDALLDSELFGHAKGAFTGAAAERAGLIEAAHHGTLFLDELFSMPLPLQAKLLRTLESGEVRRLGENHTRTVNVRVLAATNQALPQAVHHGLFRADLLYRLNTYHVHLPPLRSRPEDIPELAEHFLEEYARPVPGFSLAASDRMLAYSYPGNVRELRHAVDYAATFARGRLIEPHDLPPVFVSPFPYIPPDQCAGAMPSGEAARRETIRTALQQHSGRTKLAASYLGVSRTTLWRLKRRYGLGE